MATEVITAIISGVVAVICALLTFIATQRKARSEQIQRLEDYQKEQQKQIAQFQTDVRDEMSTLQDSYAEHIVEVKNMITDIKAQQQQYQAVMEIKLENMTKEFSNMKCEVKEHNNFAKRMPVVEEQIKVVNHRLNDLERSKA